MGRRLFAVSPYVHSSYVNFKHDVYEAWKRVGGETASSHYPHRMFQGFAYRYELPVIGMSRTEARLRFVEPISISFDTFPDYARYEVIPMIWDCWPQYYDKVEQWLKKHRVKTAIFTSKIEMEQMKMRLPELKTLWCPEGVVATRFCGGKSLQERSIDILEFGRGSAGLLNQWNGDDGELNHVCTIVDGHPVFDNNALIQAMGDARVTVCFPKSMTNPEITDGVETLTQRYWEAMLSRMVIVGHAPQELIDVIGYNPVVEVSQYGNAMLLKQTIKDVLSRLDEYQELVDRNRYVALNNARWELRMAMVKDWLESVGYEVGGND